MRLRPWGFIDTLILFLAVALGCLLAPSGAEAAVPWDRDVDGTAFRLSASSPAEPPLLSSGGPLWRFHTTFSRAEGARVLEHLRVQGMRTAEGIEKPSAFFRYPGARPVAAAPHSSRQLELHQNLVERK